MSEFIEIPSNQLSPEILTALLEEFVNREGTDYGLNEYSLEEKVAQVQRQLDSGKAYIAYDPTSESCTILLK